MPAGKLPDFADAEPEARGGEAGDARGESVRHVRHRPDHERNGVTEPGADQVDHAAEADVADRVGELEPEHDPGVVALAPAELGAQRRLEHADHLPVDVVDRGRGKQQRDDHPAVAADASVRDCCFARFDPVFHPRPLLAAPFRRLRRFQCLST
jgi:hypothetical protein